MTEMCRFYTTTGYSKFKPKCLRGFVASIKCHSRRTDCKGYVEERK